MPIDAVPACIAPATSGASTQSMLNEYHTSSWSTFQLCLLPAHVLPLTSSTFQHTCLDPLRKGAPVEHHIGLQGLELCSHSLDMSHFDSKWVLQTYPTNEYKSFEDAFEALMAEPIYRDSPPESAALACAGKACYPSPLDRLLKCSLVCDT